MLAEVEERKIQLYKHFKKRLKERYKLTVSREEYEELNTLIKSESPVAIFCCVYVYDTNNQTYIVPFKNQELVVGYNTLFEVIATALPQESYHTYLNISRGSVELYERKLKGKMELDKAQAERLKHHLASYGITEEKYFEYNNRFNGTCWICNKPPKNKSTKTGNLHIDIYDETKEFRGLVCDTCKGIISTIQRQQKENVLHYLGYVHKNANKICINKIKKESIWQVLKSLFVQSKSLLIQTLMRLNSQMYLGIRQLLERASS